MSTARRWLSRSFLVLLLLFVAVAALWAYGRLTSPTPAQVAALEAMRAPPDDSRGENGFERLAALPVREDGAPWPDCQAGLPCLERVEANPVAFAQALAPIAADLDAAEQVLRAPRFVDPRSVVAIDEAGPSFGLVAALDARRALDFVSGRRIEALAAACTDATDALRWVRRPDSLLHAMIGIAVFRDTAWLIGEMRARDPAAPLPTACAPLLEVPDASVEGSACAMLAAEWRYQQRVMPALEAQARGGGLSGWVQPLLHDGGWLAARSAERFATACGASGAETARADRVPSLSAPPPRWVDRIAFPLSIGLDGIEAPAYGVYIERLLDHVARRRLLAAGLRMGAMDPAMAGTARFEALPEALRGGPRPLAFDARNGTLLVPMRGPQTHLPTGAVAEERLPLPVMP